MHLEDRNFLGLLLLLLPLNQPLQLLGVARVTQGNAPLKEQEQVQEQEQEQPYPTVRTDRL